MPTKTPRPDVLPLDSPGQPVDAIIIEATGKLEELRNFATYAFAWIGQEPPADALRLVPCLLFRHAIEQLDAITLLVSSQAVDPAMANLRVLMETWLYTKFLVETETQKRASAYMVWYFHKRQDWFRRYLPSSETGKEFRAEIRKDDALPDDLLDKLSFNEIQEGVDRIDRILQQEEYLEMDKYYRIEMRRPRKERPKTWYNLAGSNAESAQLLAKNLGFGAFYDETNRHLSGIIHASSIMSGRISRSDREGMGAFKQIRLLNNLSFVVGLALTFGWSICRDYIDKYAPSKSVEVRRWYNMEIRDYLLRRLPQVKIKYKE